MESKLILHRGYKGKYPENSLISFENAIKEGFPTEIDIRITKDNVPVIIHDDNLDRLFNASGKISNYTLEELKDFYYVKIAEAENHPLQCVGECNLEHKRFAQNLANLCAEKSLGRFLLHPKAQKQTLTFKSGCTKGLFDKEDSTQTIATLNEFCEIMQNEENKSSFVFIHIKKLKDVKVTMDVLNNFDLKERIRFFVVDELIEPFRKIMRKNHPEYKIGLHLYQNSPYYSEDKLKLFDFIWADEINFKWIDKNKVDLAHKLNKPFYAISPELISDSIFNKNIQQRWKELLQSGVDGICTDRPDEFLSFT